VGDGDMREVGECFSRLDNELIPQLNKIMPFSKMEDKASSNEDKTPSNKDKTPSIPVDPYSSEISEEDSNPADDIEVVRASGNRHKRVAIPKPANVPDPKPAITYLRKKFSDYPVYHMVRHHYKYAVENLGSLQSGDQTAGEFFNLLLRQSVRWTNRRGLSRQLIERAVSRYTMFGLLMGMPFTYVDGKELQEKKLLTPDDRLQFFRMSAQNNQLLLPGRKLQSLLKSGIDNDHPQLAVQRALRRKFSPSLLNPIIDRNIIPVVPMRPGKRKDICINETLSEVPLYWTSVMAFREYVHSSRSFGGVTNVNGHDVYRARFETMKETLLSIFQLDEFTGNTTDDIGDHFILTKYKKLQTSNGRMKLGDFVCVNGVDDNYQYGKIAAIYGESNMNTVYDTEEDVPMEGSSPCKCAAVMVFYGPTGAKDILTGYPMYKPYDIGIINATATMSSPAHMFRHPRYVVEKYFSKNVYDGYAPLHQTYAQKVSKPEDDERVLNIYAKYSVFY
jgi:hypothetical protein